MTGTYLGVRDRVAVVTGGGRNIGRAAALALAKAGAKLVIGDLVEANAQSVAKEIEAAGGEAIGLPLDIASKPSVDAMIAATSI